MLYCLFSFSELNNCITGTRSESLEDYTKTAHHLLVTGYYSGLIGAVQECRQANIGAASPVFAVLDHCSGSGKSLAGVALRLLDEKGARLRDLSTIKKSLTEKWRVAHIFWGNVSTNQKVYDEIEAKQKKDGLYVSRFFSEFAKFAMEWEEQKGTQDDKRDFVWERLMQYLFEPTQVLGHDTFSKEQFWEKHGLEGNLLLLFIDEVPVEPAEVRILGIIRDALKTLQNTVVILSGTNSRAANMIGLTVYGAASSSGSHPADSAWSLLITRLPRYVQVPDSSTCKLWNLLKSKSDLADSEQDIMKIIESSISSMGANPRLIVFAIEILYSIVMNKKRGVTTTFDVWQRGFSQKVVDSKFTYRGSFSKTSEALNSQLNLLLEASSCAQFSDAPVSHHFGVRACPSDVLSTEKNCTVDECARWLCLCDDREKSLGKKVYYVYDEDGDEIKCFDWQTSIFAKAAADILLYLSSCRERGFFTSHVRYEGQTTSVQTYLAHEVVSAFWIDHAFGHINFQNVLSPQNSGCRLEVLTLTAICNAAAKAKSERICFQDLIPAIASELGIETSTESGLLLGVDFSELRDWSLPRYIFPDSSGTLKHDGIGFARRVKDAEKFDLEVGPYLREGEIQNLRVEAKDRDSFTIPEICTVSDKINLTEGDVGILVLRKCSGLWTDDRNYAENFKKLSSQLLERKKVGRVYVIKNDGKMEKVDIPGSGRGRFFIIQVPETSLRS